VGRYPAAERHGSAGNEGAAAMRARWSLLEEGEETPWTGRELPARCRVGEDVCADIVRKKRQGSKVVAAERNGGVGVQNCQVQGERAPIYRHVLGLGFLSGPIRLAQTLNCPNTKHGLSEC
jgi:hypothetical protein